MTRIQETQGGLTEFIRERKKQIVILASALILAGGVSACESNHYPAYPTKSNQTKNTQYNSILTQVGNSLINLHQDGNGGWRFKSEIQSPNYQTDRDVGAASVGMGFLTLANEYPNDPRWINAAEQTADWLIVVSSESRNNERYWHDYVDNNQVSQDIYTSFDDGTIGISDFFWQLYEKTQDNQYRQVSLEGLRWTMAQAETFSEDGINGYRWKWDISTLHSPYYMGIGEGQEGIIYGLANFYERLKVTDPSTANECQKYIKGGLAYIEIVRKNLANNIGSSPTVPETGIVGQNGDTAMDSGYLSGAAGGAFMYLRLHQVFGDEIYLNKAITLLDWLSDNTKGPLVKTGPNSVAWRLTIDPQEGNDNHFATGVEEGNAGIGWTFLQAYDQTNNKKYLNIAEFAGNWLLNIAVSDGRGGLAWHEDEHPTKNMLHANLDNGVAGIGVFLHDLYLVTGQKKYEDGAKGALVWIENTKQGSDNHIYWNDNGGNAQYENDPSWHWGDAGIVNFIQRMNHGSLDIPGEQPSLSSDN